jgi:hypothetical protein
MLVFEFAVSVGRALSGSALAAAAGQLQVLILCLLWLLCAAEGGNLRPAANMPSLQVFEQMKLICASWVRADV